MNNYNDYSDNIINIYKIIQNICNHTQLIDTKQVSNFKIISRFISILFLLQ